MSKNYCAIIRFDGVSDFLKSDNVELLVDNKNKGIINKEKYGRIYAYKYNEMMNAFSSTGVEIKEDIDVQRVASGYFDGAGLSFISDEGFPIDLLQDISRQYPDEKMFFHMVKLNEYLSLYVTMENGTIEKIENWNKKFEKAKESLNIDKYSKENTYDKIF